MPCDYCKRPPTGKEAECLGCGAPVKKFENSVYDKTDPRYTNPWDTRFRIEGQFSCVTFPCTTFSDSIMQADPKYNPLRPRKPK